jgi:hypothetical protein
MRARQASFKTVGSRAQLHQIYRGNATPTGVCLLGATVSFGGAADIALLLERSVLKLQWDFFVLHAAQRSGIARLEEWVARSSGRFLKNI